MKKKSNASTLMIVLLFLFVLTLITMAGSQHIILNYKMQSEMQHHLTVFMRAEEGMEQVILSLEGIKMTLPDSSISISTHEQKIKMDRCGNATFLIQSIAKDKDDKIVLSSEDIFAKHPRKKYCKKIPLHQCVWWSDG